MRARRCSTSTSSEASTRTTTTRASLDIDKAAWARVGKGENLPWINVCDSRGASSPYVSLYNLGALPSAFVIADGELVDGEMSTEKSFRRNIEKLLK